MQEEGLTKWTSCPFDCAVSGAPLAAPAGAWEGSIAPPWSSPLWPGLRALAPWQTPPSWAVYPLACRRLLPWLLGTFAVVPDAAWLGSDQQPWRTAPTAGPVTRLGSRSVSEPWGVVCCHLSRDCPRRACLCGVHGPLALVHRCARQVWDGPGVLCVRFSCSLSTFITVVHAVCALCVLLVAPLGLPPTLFMTCFPRSFFCFLIFFPLFCFGSH